MTYSYGSTVSHRRDPALGVGTIVARSRRIGAYDQWLYSVRFSRDGVVMVRHMISEADLEPAFCIAPEPPIEIPPMPTRGVPQLRVIEGGAR